MYRNFFIIQTLKRGSLCRQRRMLVHARDNQPIASRKYTRSRDFCEDNRSYIVSIHSLIFFYILYPLLPLPKKVNHIVIIIYKEDILCKFSSMTQSNIMQE